MCRGGRAGHQPAGVPARLRKIFEVEMSSFKPKEEMNLAERFMAFIKANEKVFWVLLLAFLGFSFAFGTQIASVMGPGGPMVTVGDNQEISRLEFDIESKALRNTLRMSSSLFTIEPFFPTMAPQPKYRTLYPEEKDPEGNIRRRPLNYREFLLFRGAALDQGLKISDAEFDAACGEIWKQVYATQKVNDADHLGRRGIPLPQGGQMDFRFLQAQKAEKERIIAELNKKHNFDKMRDFLQQRFADLLSGRGIPPRRAKLSNYRSPIPPACRLPRGHNAPGVRDGPAGENTGRNCCPRAIHPAWGPVPRSVLAEYEALPRSPVPRTGPDLPGPHRRGSHAEIQQLRIRCRPDSGWSAGSWLASP